MTHTPRVRQKQTFYYAAAGIALAVIVGGLLFFYLNIGNSQDSYAAGADFTSIRSGAWADNNTWNTGTYPGTIRQSTIGIDKSEHIEIRRNITSSYNLSFDQGAILTVTDTLVVLGNLILKKESTLTVGGNGVLVVIGNFNAAKTLSIASGGVIAVGGDADFKRDLTYDDSKGGELFVVGNIREAKNSNQLRSAQNEAALENQYPDIYNILNGTTTTLPITLLDFTAEVQLQQVLIRWTTESEIDNDYFTIERSADGQQHEVVGTVAGAGTSYSVQSYSLEDKNPLPGTSYYRLRQTDYDGQSEAFDWVAVSVAPEPAVEQATLSIDRVFPNPFSTSCTLAYTLSRPGPVEVQVVDIQGTLLLSQTTPGYIGKNQYTLENVTNLRPGTYLLRITQNNTVSPVQRVLKQ